MAIRRGRVPAPVLLSTKGHSVLKTRSYGMPTRTPLYPSMSRASSVAYDTRVEDYLLGDRVHNVNYLSNSTLDMSDNTVRKSRGRDQQLLRDATQAIPRGSIRDTSSVTSSPAPFGPRRFPRRFGKAGVRKSQRSSHHGSRLSPPAYQSRASTMDVVAGGFPRPSGKIRRYGPRAASLARTAHLEQEPYSPPPRRAQSVGPPPSQTMSTYTPRLSHHSRRSVPPVFPSDTGLSTSSLTSSKIGGSRSLALPPRSTIYSYSTAPVHPGYDPVYVEYEPDFKPSPSPSPPPVRRRPRVLGSSLRPAGNYYDRLLRKRGRRQGRLGPYYDVESIEGSDLSGVLSDADPYDGTYEVESDCGDSSHVSVSPSYHHQQNHQLHHHRLPDSPPISYSTCVPSDSPYYVDQDTEFVPFRPSRPLQTKGLLEICPYDDDDNNNNNDDHDADSSYSDSALPAPTTDLSLSTYLPSSLLPKPGARSPRLPVRSVVSFGPSPSPTPLSLSADTSLAVPSSQTPSQLMLESLVSSSIERAKQALSTLAIPGYSGASLLLSVEGAGLSPEGKRVGFTYTPAPIPLIGGGIGLDERLLGLRPSSTIKPVDNFLAGYMERMGALRAALNSSLDKDRSRRLQLGLSPLDSGLRPLPNTPSYTQTYDCLPVRSLASHRAEHLPVTSFRRRYDDSRTHRVDVIPLGEFQPRFPSSAQKALTIPESATGGHKLSVLDKINIKVSSESYATPQTSVAARRAARGRSVPPRAASVPPRPLYPEVDVISLQASTATATRAPPPPPRPIIVYSRGAAESRASRAKSVPPRVTFQDELPRLTAPSRRGHRVQTAYQSSDWRANVRARSVPPPPPPRVHVHVEPPAPRLRRRGLYRAASVARAVPVKASPQLPLPTAGLRAHKVPRRFLTRGAMRTGFTSLSGYGGQRVGSGRVLTYPVGRIVATRGRAPLYPLYPVAPKPKPAPLTESLRDFPKVYVPRKGPKPSNRSKAAIIASKMEPDPIKRRRPRSEFAANKYRSLRKEAQESIYTGTPRSTGLHSSVPPLPKPSTRKAIRTDDGYSKPKNLLSWKYRLDSKMSPGDLLYQPSSFIRIRERLRDAQEGMDRHRQMLDRYLPEGGVDSGDVSSGVMRRMADLEKRDPVSYRIGGGAESRRSTVKLPSYYATGVDPSNPPVSDLRRRIRKTLNKSRHTY